MWFQTLDKILNAKGAASRSGVTDESIARARTGTTAVGEAVAIARGKVGAGAEAGMGRRGVRELPQTAAVMGGVLDALLQRTLSSMAGNGAMQWEEWE